MERHTVRARWPALGALAYWRLHLQSRFPHPQRLLEDVLVGPTAHPPRSGWAAVAAVRAFRLVGELGILRGHRGARLDHRGRRWSVLARDRRHLYRDGASLQRLSGRAAHLGRGIYPLRRDITPRRRFAHLGPAAFRPRVDVRPDLLFAGLWLLRRRVVGHVRSRVGVVGSLVRGRGLLLFPANETCRPRWYRRETLTRHRSRLPYFFSKKVFSSSLKVRARSSCGRRAASLKMRGSDRGLFSTKRRASRTGTVRASRPQQIRVLCGTRGQRSAIPRLSLPETKAAGKYLAPGW